MQFKSFMGKLEEAKDHAADYETHMNKHHEAAEKGDWDKAEQHAQKAESAATRHFKATGKKIYDPGYTHGHPHITSSRVNEQADVDRVARSDFKVGASGRKSHKEIVFRNGETDQEKDDKLKREDYEMQEEKMTDAEMAERERLVKGMKKSMAGFKAKYGERAKEVMYATATKKAMKEDAEQIEEVSTAQMGHAGKTTIKHIKNPTVTQRMAAHDVKSYKDRVDLLKAAKAQGNLKEAAKDEKEYGYEGDMALNQLATLTRCAEMIKDMLKPDTDMPEWVQSKITLATDYIQTAADYMYSEMNEELKGKQHKLDKNKNGKLDAHDFKLLRKEDAELDEGEVKDAIDAHRRTRMDQMSRHSTDSREAAHKRHQAALDADRARHNTKMDSSTAASVHYDKERMKRDTYDTKRRKDSDADTSKTMDVLRDRLKNRKSKNEEVEIQEASINAREYASQGLMHPDHAAHAVHKVTGETIDFYAHGTGDKVSGKVVKNDGKAVHIKDSKGTTHKFKVQRGLPQQQNEQAPVAPTLVKHRISVTVSDPDHTMVSKRKEKMQKTVVVTHSSNKEGAQKVGEKFYKKKGFIVHDSHHAGMVNEEVELDEKLTVGGGPVKTVTTPTGGRIFTNTPEKKPEPRKSAQVTSAMDRLKARMKPVKEDTSLDEAALIKTTASSMDDNDKHIEKLKSAGIFAQQGAGANGHIIIDKRHEDKARKILADHLKEEVEIDEAMTRQDRERAATEQERRANVLKNNPKIAAEVERRRKAAEAAKASPVKENNNFDEEGNLMSDKLKFSDFIAKMNEQLLEYESDAGGVYRNTKKATYGTSYQGDDDEDKPKKPAPTGEKRGRGRPAGAKSGANQKVSSGKSYGGIAVHSLNLPK